MSEFLFLAGLSMAFVDLFLIHPALILVLFGAWIAFLGIARELYD